MQPKGDVTLVFVEPATPVIQDLQYRQLIPQEYDVRGRRGDILRAIVSRLNGDKKTNVLDELKKNGPL